MQVFRALANGIIEGIPPGLDLELNADLVLNATVDNLTLTGDIQLKTDQPVGPIYLVVDQKEDENPYHLEALIPRYSFIFSSW